MHFLVHLIYSDDVIATKGTRTLKFYPIDLETSATPQSFRDHLHETVIAPLPSTARNGLHSIDLILYIRWHGTPRQWRQEMCYIDPYRAFTPDDNGTIDGTNAIDGTAGH